MVETLTNTEFADVAIEYDYKGHDIPEDIIPEVSVDATDKLTAILNDDHVSVRVTTVDNAVGGATLTVKATLPDGVVLTQTMEFSVIVPEADAIVLHLGTPEEKPIAPPVDPVAPPVAP